ncbi:telomere-protecting terminal protein Tpg [Streptomyces sp. NPDC059008]|uniref:telomere-protecting terminal protein Tpg n=1 Tax=Streptomyces sp. NPDC059008 TaxID=3346693 RepID=UPI0036C7769A
MVVPAPTARCGRRRLRATPGRWSACTSPTHRWRAESERDPGVDVQGLRVQRVDPLGGRRACLSKGRRVGNVVSTRARFGFTAAPGSTDDARVRDITQALPPAYVDRLFTAREQGAREQGANEQQLQGIAAEGLAQMYFRADNTRADGLGVDVTDVERFDIELYTRLWSVMPGSPRLERRRPRAPPGIWARPVPGPARAGRPGCMR